MQKQHLEMVQRLLCWRVHYCNIPTEHKCLRQYHILPVYFGTCPFWTAAYWEALLSMQPSGRGPYLPRTCPKWGAINGNLPPQMVCYKIWALPCGFPLWKWVLGWKASLQWCFLHGSGTFCALCTTVLVVPKCFFLKMFANGSLPFYFLVKLALVSNGDGFLVWKDLVVQKHAYIYKINDFFFL